MGAISPSMRNLWSMRAIAFSTSFRVGKAITPPEILPYQPSAPSQYGTTAQYKVLKCANSI